MPKTELFVGNLDRDVQRKDIEDVFEKYGKLIRCDIKSKDTGPAFCFLEFEEERDAEEAVNSENGKELGGNQIRVDFVKPRTDRNGGGGGFRGRRDGGGGGFGGGGFGGGGYRGGRGGGGFRGGRGGGGPGGRSNECYQCHESGHFARECPQGGSGGGGGGGFRRGGGGGGGGGGFRRGGGGGGGGGGFRRQDRSRSPDNRYDD